VTPHGPSAVSCQQDPDIHLDQPRLPTTTPRSASTTMGARPMVAPNLIGALKTHPERFWHGTPRTTSSGAHQGSIRVPPTGIFAYLLAANAQHPAGGESRRPKVGLAIPAIEPNSGGEGAHHTRADWIGV
jgi:hypothetical protein